MAFVVCAAPPPTRPVRRKRQTRAFDIRRQALFAERKGNEPVVGLAPFEELSNVYGVLMAPSRTTEEKDVQEGWLLLSGIIDGDGAAVWPWTSSGGTDVASCNQQRPRRLCGGEAEAPGTTLKASDTANRPRMKVTSLRVPCARGTVAAKDLRSRRCTPPPCFPTGTKCSHDAARPTAAVGGAARTVGSADVLATAGPAAVLAPEWQAPPANPTNMYWSNTTHGAAGGRRCRIPPGMRSGPSHWA